MLANVIIPKFDRIFATHGFPVKIKTDNGPPFQSEKIDCYMRRHGGYITRELTLYGLQEMQRLSLSFVRINLLS